MSSNPCCCYDPRMIRPPAAARLTTSRLMPGRLVTSRLVTSLGLLGCLLLPTLAVAATDAATPAVLNVPAIPPAAPDGASKMEQTVEVLRLQAALAHDVPHLVARTPASDAAWIALARAELAGGSDTIDRPQLVVVVDRNPRVQQLVIVLAAPAAEDWRVIGGTRVSTGSTGRFDHYITPRGVFHVTPAILGFRAEGTLNENGIRGLGAKGMRVWDFGWQVAAKGWNAGPGKPDRIPIRLMLHATDPDKLEQRIGQPASQGCIRIPAAMNRFLDRHGVLDVEYERAAVTEIRFRALLSHDRDPSPLAGNTLVVVDSSDKKGTDVANRTIP